MDRQILAGVEPALNAQGDDLRIGGDLGADRFCLLVKGGVDEGLGGSLGQLSSGSSMICRRQKGESRF